MKNKCICKFDRAAKFFPKKAVKHNSKCGKSAPDYESILWRTFSKYIRLNSANSQGAVQCYTCGVYKHWKDVDAGHYIKRECHATKFDERNVKPQCKKCNRFMGGNQDEFAIHLIKDYGPGILEELHQLKNSYFKFTDKWLKEKIDEYKTKTVVGK